MIQLPLPVIPSVPTDSRAIKNTGAGIQADLLKAQPFNHKD